MRKGLTIQQEKFCLKYHECGNASEAYKYAYPRSLKWKYDSLNCEASKLRNNTKVLQRIKELEEEAQQASLITKEGNLKILHEIMNNPNANETARIKAIEVSNKMLGYDAPVKSEVTGRDGKDLFESNDYSKLTIDELKTLKQLHEKMR